jgi:hypothetical protein
MRCNPSPTPLPTDLGLAQTVAAWPALPAHLKAAVLALAEATSG